MGWWKKLGSDGLAVRPQTTAGPRSPRVASGSVGFSAVFERLDFVYLPSRDVEADVKHYTDRLGGSSCSRSKHSRLAWQWSALPPTLPRCCSPGIWLETSRSSSSASMTSRARSTSSIAAGGDRRQLRDPAGPAVELISPGPQRLALYQLTRPEALDRLAGRRDF